MHAEVLGVIGRTIIGIIWGKKEIILGIIHKLRLQAWVGI